MMILLKLVVLCGVAGMSWGKEVSFPEWFKFGTASSSYQVEGAWNVSDKGESVWDRFVHSHPELANGDVATDSYHMWRRDVEMLHELGVDFYRFSISWPRLLPKGSPQYVSEDGARYYSDLIDGLLERGIEPVVTIYHWELPQMLQDMGGWTNPLITTWFADYARVVFSLYGDRVKTWITINEPISMCDFAYTNELWAPEIVELEYSGYLCNKLVMIAHAKAWRIYDEEFKPKYGGKVSIGNFLWWVLPRNEEDEQLSELALEWLNGRYYHPIYSAEGGWPPVIERVIHERSIQQGYPRSKLPPFTDEEIQLVKGTYDYQSVNYYTARIARAAGQEEAVSSFFLDGILDLDLVMETDPEWETQLSDLVPLYPEGLRHGLSWLRQKYGHVNVFVVENGFGSEGKSDDDDRSRFIDLHLEQILLSIEEDKLNVTGYTYWSLMDSYEWASNYEYRFGLYEVDFSSPELTRTPRSSAEHYSRIIKEKRLDANK